MNGFENSPREFRDSHLGKINYLFEVPFPPHIWVKFMYYTPPDFRRKHQLAANVVNLATNRHLHKSPIGRIGNTNLTICYSTEKYGGRPLMNAFELTPREFRDLDIVKIRLKNIIYVGTPEIIQNPGVSHHQPRTNVEHKRQASGPSIGGSVCQ